jgi:hypothetical protein
MANPIRSMTTLARACSLIVLLVAFVRRGHRREANPTTGPRDERVKSF